MDLPSPLVGGRKNGRPRKERKKGDREAVKGRQAEQQLPDVDARPFGLLLTDFMKA